MRRTASKSNRANVFFIDAQLYLKNPSQIIIKLNSTGKSFLTFRTGNNSKTVMNKGLRRMKRITARFPGKPLHTPHMQLKLAMPRRSAPPIALRMHEKLLTVSSSMLSNTDLEILPVSSKQFH